MTRKVDQTKWPASVHISREQNKVSCDHVFYVFMDCFLYKFYKLDFRLSFNRRVYFELVRQGH